MGKIKINMLSKADSVEGQGVGSAYKEQVKLVTEGASDIFDVTINKRKGKFDIYHIHSVNPSYYIKMRRKRKKSVFVCYVHFLPDTLEGSIKLPKPIFYLFKKYVLSIYRMADEIVVVNPIFIAPLVSLGIKEERITYIPNFVSKDEFYLTSEEINDTKRKNYHIDTDKFIVFGVGQIQHRKGVLDFVEVAKKNPHMQFVWAGGFSFGKITDGYKELKEVVDNPPVNVKFLGIIKRTEMNYLFNISDCLFMPSYNELFPMSILEAVNSNKPLLLRDLELYEDILFHKYVKGKNNDEFSLLLNKLNDDSEFYQEQTNNSKFISEFYSKENVLDIWRKYYPHILMKNPKKKK